MSASNDKLGIWRCTFTARSPHDAVRSAIRDRATLGSYARRPIRATDRNCRTSRLGRTSDGPWVAARAACRKLRKRRLPPVNSTLGIRGEGTAPVGRPRCGLAGRDEAGASCFGAQQNGFVVAVARFEARGASSNSRSVAGPARPRRSATAMCCSYRAAGVASEGGAVADSRATGGMRRARGEGRTPDA